MREITEAVAVVKSAAARVEERLERGKGERVMLTNGQLEMVENAARNTIPTDEKGQMIVNTLLELIEERLERGKGAMLMNGQLEMVENAARNIFPIDERGQMIVNTLLELIEERLFKKGEGAMLEATCPNCGAPLRLEVDDSSGPPRKIGMECDCGAIPVWQLDWDYAYALGEYMHDESVKFGKGVD